MTAAGSPELLQLVEDIERSVVPPLLGQPVHEHQQLLGGSRRRCGPGIANQDLGVSMNRLVDAASLAPAPGQAQQANGHGASRVEDLPMDDAMRCRRPALWRTSQLAVRAPVVVVVRVTLLRFFCLIP